MFFIEKIIRKYLENKLPTPVDAEGAAVAIFRLQDTYNLNAHDIANGVIAVGYQFDKLLGTRRL